MATTPAHSAPVRRALPFCPRFSMSPQNVGVVVILIRLVYTIKEEPKRGEGNPRDKENVEPNLRQQSPSQASSKAQLISARLAEWKKRMGVEPTPPLPSAVASRSPSSPSFPSAERSPPGRTAAVAHEQCASLPSGEEDQGPAVLEAREQEPVATEGDTALLVLDFGGPAKPTTRPGFVPGAHSRRLLAARAQKKQEEEAAAAAASSAALHWWVSPLPFLSQSFFVKRLAHSFLPQQ
jgi:hypothetical protein